MKKILIYAMQGEKMCFLHALMNAKQLIDNGYKVSVVLEGKSVALPKTLTDEKNPLFSKLLEEGVIAGVCLACSKMLGSYEDNEALGLKFLADMTGHTGVYPYLEEGYSVLVF